MSNLFKTLIILLLVLISIVICAGCNRTNPSETTTILDFIQDEGNKKALTTFSEDSLKITNEHKYSQYYYDYYSDGTPAYYYANNGVIETNSTMAITDNTEIISDLKKYPGLFVWVICNYNDSGITGVFFSRVKKSDVDEGQYDQESIIYTDYPCNNLLELGFKDLGGGWYYELIQLPITPHMPN